MLPIHRTRPLSLSHCLHSLQVQGVSGCGTFKSFEGPGPPPREGCALIVSREPSFRGHRSPLPPPFRRITPLVRAANARRETAIQKMRFPSCRGKALSAFCDPNLRLCDISDISTTEVLVGVVTHNSQQICTWHFVGRLRPGYPENVPVFCVPTTLSMTIFNMRGSCRILDTVRKNCLPL